MIFIEYCTAYAFLIFSILLAVYFLQIGNSLKISNQRAVIDLVFTAECLEALFVVLVFLAEATSCSSAEPTFLSLITEFYVGAKYPDALFLVSLDLRLALLLRYGVLSVAAD